MNGILQARADDAEALTKIALAAKRYWGYPEKWMLHWREALTVTGDYISRNPTFIAVIDGEPVGFHAIQITNEGALLDHLWVLPEFMGRGVGRALFQHAESISREHRASRMVVVGDPHAEQFYVRMGARVYGRQEADMDGESRSLPLLEKVL